jgi:hypothetical protein
VYPTNNLSTEHDGTTNACADAEQCGALPVPRCSVPHFTEQSQLRIIRYYNVRTQTRVEITGQIFPIEKWQVWHPGNALLCYGAWYPDSNMAHASIHLYDFFRKPHQ